MKMEKPSLELVRFSSGDIIATSSRGMRLDDFNNIKGRSYAILGVERNEAAEAGIVDWGTDDRVWVSAGDYSNGTFGWHGYPSEEGLTEALAYIQSHIYVWYHQGEWRTEGREVISYQGNYPRE